VFFWFPDLPLELPVGPFCSKPWLDEARVERFGSLGVMLLDFLYLLRFGVRRYFFLPFVFSLFSFVLLPHFTELADSKSLAACLDHLFPKIVSI